MQLRVLFHNSEAKKKEIWWNIVELSSCLVISHFFSFIWTNLLVFTNLWGDKKGHKGQNCHVRVWSKKLYSVCMTMWFRGVKWKETFGWIYPRREFNTQKACLVIILGYLILNQLVHSKSSFCKNPFTS